MYLSCRGFTLIEMVFAIIIVGFSILSIPLIIQHSSNNLKQSSEVKGFYHALALMQIVRVKPWDTNNIGDMKLANIYYVLDTDESKSPSPYECKEQNDGFRRRVGMSATSFKDRRYCSNAIDEDRRKASAISGNSLESINFSSYSEIVGGFEVAAEVAYVNSSSLAIFDAGKTSNTKLITITLGGKNPPRNIAKYYYYATNIGTDTAITKSVK
ncbi:MAG: prepilin-type N-terminal cleavage/methylation domain-containing protein [Wolinella sp.]